MSYHSYSTQQLAFLLGVIGSFNQRKYVYLLVKWQEKQQHNFQTYYGGPNQRHSSASKRFWVVVLSVLSRRDSELVQLRRQK
jgi:hypothetical protein